MPGLTIMLATPSSAASRSGNQVTANRWRGILENLGHRVIAPEQAAGETVDLLIAIHAWRSAGVISAMRQHHPALPVIVCLSGTDIYAFQASHPDVTHASMAAATALIGLHDLVDRAIPEAFRPKLRIIHQSAPVVARQTGRPDAFDVCVIGHLRAEKDPFRAALASRLLPGSSRIAITHVGAAHDASWAAQADVEMAAAPRYRWYGEVSGAATRDLLATSRLMVLSSVMEGGANVLGEAIRAGLPVIASDIDGSVGLLGPDYEGHYPVGDTAALAQLLSRAENDAPFLDLLTRQCAARAPLFAPERERLAWQRLLDDVMAAA
jgi:putative glycosyltransferase (TIGR04348 family)